MTQLALIFPGQGAQTVGMAKDVVDTSSRAKAVFDQANELLGFDLAKLCFEGPTEDLEKTDIQQPAIFVASVAIWEAFLEAGGKREAFSWAGGLSLGEYTALHVAGAVEFQDALRLVRRRGELMQQAAEATPSGMVSLIGGDKEKALALCEKARQADVLAPANFNCPGQVVISGSKSACERAVSLASEFELRAIPLAVAGAFHSSLMQPAADGLWSVLKETTFTKPTISVIANVNAEFQEEPEAIRESLKDQLTEPVLWQKCVEQMISAGVNQFVEFGPGRVLTGLMRKIDRKFPCMCISNAEGIQKALTQLCTS